MILGWLIKDAKAKAREDGATHGVSEAQYPRTRTPGPAGSSSTSTVPAAAADYYCLLT